MPSKYIKVAVKKVWNKGRTGIYSEETRKKMALGRKNKVPWNKGKTGIYSEETKKSISEKLKGRKIPKEEIIKREQTKRNIRKIDKNYSMPKTIDSEKIAARVRKAWADGKYDNSKPSGGYKWYEYKGQKFQCTYELRLAKAFDIIGIKYIPHPKDKLQYVLDGVTHTYNPDFKVYKYPSWFDLGIVYFEPKSTYFVNLQKAKLRELTIKYKILVLDEEGIEYFERIAEFAKQFTQGDPITRKANYNKMMRASEDVLYYGD